MENFDTTMKDAYALFGSTIAIKKWTVEYLNYRGQTCVHYISNPYYFFRKGEPTFDNWKNKYNAQKEGLVRHCVPQKNGYYDYVTKKFFPTLESWYQDTLEKMPAAEGTWQENILYGKNSATFAKSITIQELFTQVQKSVEEANTAKIEDSFDLLFRNVRFPRSRQDRQGFFVDLETGDFIQCLFNDRKNNWDWDSSKPRWFVHYTKNNLYKQVNRLSEMGITTRDLYILQDGKFKRLDELMN